MNNIHICYHYCVILYVYNFDVKKSPLQSIYCSLLGEAAKKVIFLVAGPLRGGGEAKRVCH